MDNEVINKTLNNLGLKSRAKRIFLFLLGSGVSPASEISFGLHIPKSSVYDSLDELLARSLIVEYSANRSKEYGVIDPEQLIQLNSEKIKELQADQENLVEIIKKTKKTESIAKPKVKFYMGQNGIKQAFRDTLWNNKQNISYIMWSTKDMFEIMGLEFSIWHSSLRQTAKVHLKIIEKESDQDFAETVEGAKDLIASPAWGKNSERRIAPKDADWKMSFWVYDNKCMFASGGGEKIALVIDSKEYSDLMILLWEQMWKNSREK